MEVASISFGGGGFTPLRRLVVEDVGVSGCNRMRACHIELLAFLQCGGIGEIETIFRSLIPMSKPREQGWVNAT